MKAFILAIALALGAGAAQAHEMTPTYPRLVPSHLDGILKATMQMFNRRADVEYYEVGVFDEDFNPVPFVTAYHIFKLEYQSQTSFDVYIREKDKDRAVYICSRSKVRKNSTTKPALSSRICSKIEDR